MFILQQEDLDIFIEELRQLLPYSSTILNLARNCQERNNLAWPGIEFVTDQFPHFTACVVRPSPSSSEHVPRPNHPTYTVCAKDTDALKSLLEEKDVVNWSEPAIFSPVWEPLSESVQSVIKKHGAVTGPETRKDFRAFAIIFRKERLTESPVIPDELTLRQLSREDMKRVNSTWYFGKTCQTENYLLYLYDQGFATFGIFTQDDELVAYEVCNAEMNITAAYVKPEYRNRKLFHILTHSFCKKMFSLGLESTFGFVTETNLASQTSLYRAGGEKAENYNINQLVYTPNNYSNKNNTLLTWLSSLP